jgi:hypothetical protein
MSNSLTIKNCNLKQNNILKNQNQNQNEIDKKINNLMLELNYSLINKDNNKIKKIYIELKKPENKLSIEISTKNSINLNKMEKIAGRKDEKGFWEYSIFQKIIIPNEEQNIKYGLKPDNGLDLNKIEDYINPKLSREEQIYINFKNGKILSSIELIIYNNYIQKKKYELEKDLNDINKLGTKATPITIEGKIHYMMYLLNIFINKNDTDNIANIYLKLKDPKYLMNEELNIKYTDLINKMNNIIDNLDLIELQFTKFYNQMPPLNQKGFVKFDDWQIKTIENINNNISTIICAPTSAGKTVLSGYTITKGRSLYLVPTDALAWQVASYIGNITNTDVPIVTLTYQSIPKKEDLIKLLNNSNAIVGTSEIILDYLPFINCNFKWIIFDEIHMMGKKEGSAMESIAKILNNVPFIGLSATIGNVNELKSWFEKIFTRQIDIISCNKRFFNLQKYFFDQNTNKLIMLNPLGLVTYDEFESKSILNKILNQTPQDTWSLATKLIENNIELGDLNPYKYFNKCELIELTKTYEYFNDLIKFMTHNYNIYEIQIKNILSEYSAYNFKNYNVNLINLIEELKNNDKFPSIIFQQNTISCLEIIRNLSEELDIYEENKFSGFRKERMIKDKNDKRLNKKLEKELNSLTDKKLDKKIKENKDFVFDLKIENDIDAPHDSLIFNIDNKFSDSDIKEWAEKFKIYFPCINGNYHYLIRLLWRGIGVYVNGLPDSYLRLIQKLSSKKKLAIVFSDMSLVFGISMPFRSSIIYNYNDTKENLDPMMYQQMAGRAGRRGLDKEGNIIFVGYSWNKIKELCTSPIPNIEGANKLIWTYNHAFNICQNQNYLTINNNMFKSIITDEYISKINENIQNNINIEVEKNLIQLLWMFRYSNESIIVYTLLPHLKKYFEICNPNEESKQVEIAYFLSMFINIKNGSEDPYLSKHTTSKINYKSIYEELKKSGINIQDNIDSKIWISIRNNCLVDIKDDELRQELFDFSTKLKSIQHYCYHTKQVNLTKLLGKLLTRIWWIYHTSSPIIRTSKEQYIIIPDMSD